jgi:hypothetical protein
MNIKQALKKKNVLVNEIKQEFVKANTYNSVEVGNKRAYSASVALQNYFDKTNELIALKTAIHIANAPVYDKIFRLSELKSVVKYLNALNCQEGKEQNRYGSVEPRILEVEIDIVKRDTMVKTFEVEIDKLQEELDYHNATTELK